MNKKTMIQTLEEIALYLELLGENPFKIQAYRKAANTLEKDDRSLDEMDDLFELKGIGKSTGQVLKDLLETGKSSTLEQLKEEVPSGLVDLLRVPGLGGKRIARLYKELSIDSLESLYEACKEQKVSQLSGFGKKTEQNYIVEIERLNERVDRHPYWRLEKVVHSIEKELEAIEEVIRFSVAGSFRRREETSSDLDFIVATNEAKLVTDQLLQAFDVEEVIASGGTKLSFTIRAHALLDIDFRFVKDEEFATALHHFTGSKDHNVRMRQIAKARNEKISEYGVEQADGTVRTFETEAAFFNHFDLPFIPPTIRQDGTEVDRMDQWHRVVQYEDIRGDFHMHTTWSDGAYSIEEMGEALRKEGYTHAVITDHSHYLQIANGLSPERLRKQIEEVRQVNEKWDDFELMIGTEMDILPDGTLDFDDDLLQELDFVIASIHRNFDQTEEEIMHRLRAACENPYVDMIAHPTGRVVGERAHYAIQVDEFLRIAKETDTIVEFNANPYRFDLAVEALKKAVENGNKIAINTDAHDITHFPYMKLGVEHAQKAWVPKELVVNTWSLERFKEKIVNKRKDV